MLSLSQILNESLRVKYCSDLDAVEGLPSSALSPGHILRITGLPGSGRSRIAKQYATDALCRDRKVCWLACSGLLVAANAPQHDYSHSKLRQTGVTDPIQLLILLRKLRTEPTDLIVIDDFDQLMDTISAGTVKGQRQRQANAFTAINRALRELIATARPAIILTERLTTRLIGGESYLWSVHLTDALEADLVVLLFRCQGQRCGFFRRDGLDGIVCACHILKEAASLLASSTSYIQ